MPRTESPAQKKTVERVMHEYKHGELKSGPGGRAGKVKNPKQAIAIALHEAGASKYESKEANRRNLRHTKVKEARGETAKDAAEGKGGRAPKNAGSARRRSPGERTKAELYAEAKRRGIAGRSKMDKSELQHALHH